MYKTVSSYNDKRVIEKDKNETLSYKYLLTKTIQDDFVNAVKKQKINQKQVQ